MAVPKFKIEKAVKAKKKARIALDGFAGSGKTYTALELATGLAAGGKIAVLDTEEGSASLYGNLFDFDHLQITDHSPLNYVEALKFLGDKGYEVVIIDSLTHAWAGANGSLEQVDKAKARYGNNSYVAWKDVTPMHNKLVAAMLKYPGHLIVTMRTTVEYALEKDDKSGKSTPRKVGMKPIMRDGVEFEFDVVCDISMEHVLVVSKTRLPVFDGRVVEKAGRELGEEILADLNSGVALPEPAPEAAPPPSPGAAHDQDSPFDDNDELPDPGPIEIDEPFQAPGGGTVQPLEQQTVAKAQYGADGVPANPEAEAFDTNSDAQAALLRTAEAMVDAYEDGDTGAVETKYAGVLEEPGKLLSYMITKLHLSSAKQKEARRSAGFGDTPWPDLTTAQRLCVAMHADEIAKEAKVAQADATS